MTDQPATLAAALAELQTGLPRIGRTATAQYGKYADLAGISREVLPLMGKLGLSFITRPTLNEEGQFVLLWSLLHISGDHESGQYPLPGMDKGPQALGSAITYARRYTLCAVTGIAPDDDDDDGAAAEEAPREAANGGRWMNRRPDIPPAQLQGKRTPTRTTGSEHEQLRTGTVEIAPEDRPAQRVKGDTGPDLWQGQPPGTYDTRPPEELPGSMSDPQRGQLFMLFASLGLTRPTAQRDVLSDILHRTISSRKDLSYVDAEVVLKDLAARAEAKEAAEAAQAAAAEQDTAAEATP